jgi:hypothetical protein
LKPKHFSSRHIHVTIKPPSDKALDLEDEYDRRKAMGKLLDEWIMLDEEVRFELFNQVVIRHDQDRVKLPE